MGSFTRTNSRLFRIGFLLLLEPDVHSSAFCFQPPMLYSHFGIS